MRLMASTPRRLPVTRLVAALVWLHATALLGQVSDTTSSWPRDVPPDVPLFDRDITRILSGDAASFVYDFGALGWPSGWSPYGMSPQWVALNFNGIPFDDPVTGRPHYDLLPTALLAPPWMREAARGSPVLADAGLRTFDTAEPLTELHYQTGDDGLKRATVLHGQTRGAVTGLFVYSGAGAKGEYPGSRLQRMRQLLLRAGFRRSGWSADAMYLHSQRRLGAHGGVEGPAIYNRLIADVRLSAAMRRAIRHDAQLVLRARPFGAPLVATAAFTAYHPQVHPSGAGYRKCGSLPHGRPPSSVRELGGAPYQSGVRDVVRGCSKTSPDCTGLCCLAQVWCRGGSWCAFPGTYRACRWQGTADL